MRLYDAMPSDKSIGEECATAHHPEDCPTNSLTHRAGQCFIAFGCCLRVENDSAMETAAILSSKSLSINVLYG